MHRSSRAPLRLPFVVAALALIAAPSRAGVIVVAPAGGGDFTSAQAAVAAAAEGDTLLLKPANCTDCYEPGLSVGGKSLTIVFDSPAAPATAYYFESIYIHDLQYGQTVVLRGLRGKGLTAGMGSSLTLENNAGGVWIENCELTGAAGTGDAPFGCAVTADIPGGAGLEARNCDAVTIVGSTLIGGRGCNKYVDPNGFHFNFQATDGGVGLLAKNSLVAVYDSTLTGGVGGTGHLCSEFADGGFGIAAQSSMVLLSGCTLTGGLQGAGPPAGAPGGGVRGDASSSIELLGSNIVPAPGGVAFDTAPGTITNYPGPARSFKLPSPLREQQAGTLAMQGAQGDFVGFFWSLDNGALPMPVRNGWFVLSGPLIAGPFLLGSIASPSGAWNLPFTTPNLPPAAKSMTFLLQAYFAYPGGVTLGSGTAFTLLDGSL